MEADEGLARPDPVEEPREVGQRQLAGRAHEHHAVELAERVRREGLGELCRDVLPPARVLLLALGHAEVVEVIEAAVTAELFEHAFGRADRPVAKAERHAHDQQPGGLRGDRR